MHDRIDAETNEALDHLESQAIYILREGYRKFSKLAMLWSIGKDSTVLLWLAKKAFLGEVPFALIHIDTTFKIPEMIAFRDRLALEYGLNLIVGRNEEALAAGMSHTRGRIACCNALKTEALQQVMARHGLQGLFLGIRRDEDGTRSKERYFSPRNQAFQWNFRDQPPEFWDQFKTHFGPDHHIRIHPILDWTELNVWQYIQRENIPVIDLYFAKNGRRYRSLGCAPCTNMIASTARTVEEIIEELKRTRTSERAGRAQDQEEAYAMQKLRVLGYM